MSDKARLVSLAISQRDGGEPGYKIENPFGQTIQVLPRPPAFEATVVLAWEGAMPEDVEDLVRRYRAMGAEPTG